MNSDRLAGILIVAFALVGFILGLMTGSGIKSSEFKREAVAHGHAEWVVDENGSPEWQWKEGEE